MAGRALLRERIRAVFFDVQGTLIDREASWRKAFAEALGEFAARWEGDGFSPEKAADRFAEVLRAGRGRACGHGAKARPSRRLRLAAMKAALAGSPFDVTPSFLDNLYRRTKALVPACPAAAPGARDVLARLARRYRLGIISNSGRDRIMRMLAEAGLDGFFGEKAVFVPAGRGRGKPGGRIFRGALAAFRVQPGQAVMVGDSWRNDVLGARRCGMHAVHVSRGGTAKARRLKRRPAVVRVSGLRQLLGLLEG